MSSFLMLNVLKAKIFKIYHFLEGHTFFMSENITLLNKK